MRVSDFVKQFTINPKIDIEPNFRLTKRLDIDANSHNSCFNCDDKLNNIKLKSSPWTSVQYCWACDHLNVVYHQDRMGGSVTDTIECFTENLNY